MSAAEIHLALNQPRGKQTLWRVVTGVPASWKWLAEFRNWNRYESYPGAVLFKKKKERFEENEHCPTWKVEYECRGGVGE